ncbi:phage portal protein [Tessaracoccus sp. HDW20]|uniref:phage portal protein n=1 Tax=Tessaracoccus coleopterorum TaxID=2714950 RepID=UPI0018D2A9A9|nr:phage portal protein [Tessaracoccus coleopterorum]
MPPKRSNTSTSSSSPPGPRALPIEAARRGIQFADGAAAYSAEWWNGSGQPSGILSSDQSLTADKARQYRNTWNDLDDEGRPIERTANPSGIKVLGAGLSYEPIMLKPADALWLEAMDFSTIDIARIYGTPHRSCWSASTAALRPTPTSAKNGLPSRGSASWATSAHRARHHIRHRRRL